MVKIPDKIAGIFNFVYKTPVTEPANMPPAMAPKTAHKGLAPTEIKDAAIAAPNGKLPSQVMSGTSSTRKDKNTPMASMDHISPCATVEITKSPIHSTSEKSLRSCILSVIEVKLSCLLPYVIRQYNA